MVRKFKSYTIEEYLTTLSEKLPTPGGGSAAALSGALGASLIAMVANYSVKKFKTKSVEKRIKHIRKKSNELRRLFVKLIDKDAQVYKKVVKVRNKPAKEKKEALRQAKAVSEEVCQLCYQGLQLTPDLIKHGNQSLLSDVEVAVEMFRAAYNGSLALSNDGG